MPSNNLQDYFKPLEDIYSQEYPIPERELSSIVQNVMNGLDIVAKRLKDIRNKLSSEEQVRADSFLFYLDAIKEKDISPLNAEILWYPLADKKVLIRRVYSHDISFGTEAGW